MPWARTRFAVESRARSGAPPHPSSRTVDSGSTQSSMILCSNLVGHSLSFSCSMAVLGDRPQEVLDQMRLLLDLQQERVVAVRRADLAVARFHPGQLAGLHYLLGLVGGIEPVGLERYDEDPRPEPLED